MVTRSTLATLCLLPALAAAQVPPRPPRLPSQAPSVGPVPPGRQVPGQPAQPPPFDRPGAARPVPTPSPGSPPVPAPATQPAPGAPGANDQPLQPAGSDNQCRPISGKFLLTFTKADMVDLLEQASRWTCRNFIYGEDVAKGKITLLSKTAVSADEAYAAFLASLASNGIALYQTGRYWKLVRIADAKKVPIPTFTTDGSEAPATEQPITKVIRLQYADADQVRGVLGNFISTQGADLQSLPPDLLIITDVGVNLRRLEKLLETIDRPGSSEVVRFIQIRFAAAKDVADKVNQVFAQGAATAGKTRRGLSVRPASPVPGGAPPAPGAPSPAPGAPGAAADVQVSKVIPDDRTNKIIVISDEKSFDRINELVQQLDVPTSEEGGIHVVYLKNATAEELATTLSNLAQGKSKSSSGAPSTPINVPGQPARPAAAPATPGAATAELFTGDVKITADKRQNALVIQSSGADIVAIRRLIEKLDQPRRQVFVEAVIMEVNLTSGLNFGVGMHGAVPVSTSSGQGFIPIASAPGRINTVGPLANVQSVIGLGGFLTGFSGPVSASLKDLGLNIPSIGVMVQALQTSSDVNVISTPHILASDNEESEITVGQNVPFQAAYSPSSSLLSNATSGTANSALGSLLGTGGLGSLYAPIQRQPVELRLKIKPQISEGDNIRLQIDEQTEEIVSTDATLGPTTAKRTVKTQIVARDQSTIVIGGLIQERNTRNVKKIPFLGSLPILGWLFRDTTNTKTKTNLLLFLTPYIIRDESDYRRIYEKKRKEQQEFIEQFYGSQPGYEVAVDFTRKAGPYSRLRRDVKEEIARPENGGDGGPADTVVTPVGKGRRPIGVTPPGAGPVVPMPSMPATPAPAPLPEPPGEAIPPQPEVPPLVPPGAPTEQP